MKRTIMMMSLAFLMTAGMAWSADSVMEAKFRLKYGRTFSSEQARPTLTESCCDRCGGHNVVRALTSAEQRSLSKLGTWPQVNSVQQEGAQCFRPRYLATAANGHYRAKFGRSESAAFIAMAECE